MSLFRFALLGLASATLAGCAALSSGPQAVAHLEPTRGNTVTGDVRFVQQGDKVHVSGEVRGLQPDTEHGFHVHEKGDCSSGDGNSAAGHFNPLGKPHGQHGHGDHHTGDLVSVRADANGVARFSFDSTSLSLGSGATDIIGRGLIVHAQPDDFKTQPTGNSGARLACAVIQAQ